jgi:uncharacterized protein YkwD
MSRGSACRSARFADANRAVQPLNEEGPVGPYERRVGRSSLGFMALGPFTWVHGPSPFLIVGLAVALLPASVSASVRSCPAGDAKPEAASASVLEQATLCLLNAERAARHLRPLISDQQLRSIALRHSRDMVDRHYFAHRGPDGLNFLAQMTRLYQRGGQWQVGENIAWGENYTASPRSIVSLWMHSPHHRHNILTADYLRIGIGVVERVPHERGLPGATYTTGFGS